MERPENLARILLHLDRMNEFHDKHKQRTLFQSFCLFF